METGVSAFIFSRDLGALLALKQTFGQYRIQVTTCRSAFASPEALKQKRFDLYVLDFELPGATELLGSLHRNGANPAHTTIVLIGKVDTVPDVMHQRVRHILSKPLVSDTVTRIVKLVYGLVVMEKRTYFRCAVRINASAAYQESFRKLPLQNTVLRDISQSGLCMKTETVLPKNATVFVDFQLPGYSDRIHVIGTVIWNDKHGHAGLQFQKVASVGSMQLRNWLNVRCPWDSELALKTPSSH